MLTPWYRATSEKAAGPLPKSCTRIVRINYSTQGLDLSRFDAAPLKVFFSARETDYGAEANGRDSGRCGALRPGQRVYKKASGIGFGGWPFDAEQMDDGTS